MRRALVGLAAACLLVAGAGSVTFGAAPDLPEVSEASVAKHLDAIRAQAMEDFRRVQQRILTVAYRLATGGVAICGEARAPALGASIARGHDFFTGSKPRQVEALFGAGEAVRVYAVVPGSAAERAGLREGDEILEVDGRRIKRTKFVFEQLRASQAGEPLLRVRREGSERELRLPRELGCDSGVRVRVSPHIDTQWQKNGKEIWVPSGLAGFVRDDDELAIAIAHQIGHRLIGSFRSAEDEPRADRLALYLAARAGFAIDGAPAFWDRVAAHAPWKIPEDAGRYTIEHGALALRAPVIRATVAEIQALVAAGRPIAPGV